VDTLNFCCTSPLPNTGVGNFTNGRCLRIWLQAISPAITPLALTPEIVLSFRYYRLDGNSRMWAATVDVGAYEFHRRPARFPMPGLQQYGLRWMARRMGWMRTTTG